eukprot:jgi/Orpsp1_1/1189494/evm.model.d7180000072432.1
MLSTEYNKSNKDNMNFLLSNNYWTRTNYGLSLNYAFINKYFLRNINFKSSIKKYKDIESYRFDRKKLMNNILRDFIDKEIYSPTIKNIEKPKYAIILLFEDENLTIVGPLSNTEEQAEIEGKLTLFKILYHFNCKLLPFVEGNNYLMKKFNKTKTNDNNNEVESIEYPEVFSKSGWENI